MAPFWLFCRRLRAPDTTVRVLAVCGASRRYQTWLEAMGEPQEWKGGRNSSLSPDYSALMFWTSDIALVLSPVTLTHSNLNYWKTVRGVQLYRVKERMEKTLQVDSSDFEFDSNEI